MMYTEIQGFEWDAAKARQNALKHGVTFQLATTVFHDRDRFQGEDTAHSDIEQRQYVIGESVDRRLLTVIFTMRVKAARIISARPAARKERETYYASKRKY